MGMNEKSGLNKLFLCLVNNNNYTSWFKQEFTVSFFCNNGEVFDKKKKVMLQGINNVY